MKLTYWAALLYGCCIFSAKAQTNNQGYTIQGRIKGLTDSTCVLAHWYHVPGQYIPKDTARVGKDGRMVFKGKDKLPQGLYLVVTPKQRYAEFTITDDQDFSFETDTTNINGHMTISGSKENEDFYAYRQQMEKFYLESQAIDTQRKQGNDPASVAQFGAELNTRAESFRNQFLKDNAGSFAVKLIKANTEPEVPAPPKAKNGRPDSTWTFAYYKNHFWDGFDLSDSRFLRTPFLQPKIDRYLKELTVQVPDSLIKEAEMLIRRTQPNKEMQEYMIYYITNQYERPKILGTDAVFIHMAEKYYLTGIMPLSDSAARAVIVEKVNTLKPLLIGKTFPTPSITDTLQRSINFAGITTPYTVVFLYAPHCGHCREATPKLKKFMDANRAKTNDVTVIAIPIEDSVDDWRKFIREFKIQKWVNGRDFTNRTDFRHRYDVFTTPTIYVLDKQKKILARALPAEQVEDFIGFHKQQANKKSTTSASQKTR